MGHFCTYPVPNQMASAARPTLCGASGDLLLTSVPYLSGPLGQVRYEQQGLCLKHSCETAVWKWAQSLPKAPFTEEEIIFLLDCGFDLMELQPPDGPAPENQC